MKRDVDVWQAYATASLWAASDAARLRLTTGSSALGIAVHD
jgi:hypothetical protein